MLPVKPTVNGPRFELLRSFELMIPTDYIHATQLDSFVKNNYGRCDHDITDEHFSGVSYELVPGKTYECRIYKIAKHVSVSPQDCLAFMKKIGAFFVGAQGLSLAFQCKQRELPSLYFVTSFDEEVRLWKGPDHYFRAPHTHGNRDDIGWEFGLSYFYCGLRSTDCLLCFCDKPSD